MLHSLTTKVLRRLNNLLNLRPASYPYISGDGFRLLADHIYDETHRCNSNEIKGGDVVFLKADMIDVWFEKVHPSIKVGYTLITHNSDRTIGQKESVYVDEKIIKWFAQNVNIRHEKMVPLPIGLENLHYYQNGIWKIFDKIKKQRKSPKTKKILFGFNISTNVAERKRAYDILTHMDLAEEIEGWPPIEKYLKKMDSYMFIASPQRGGIDCHRTWEALYLGTIPIVISSVGVEYFKKLGLPLWIISDWEEIKDLNEIELEKKYHELVSTSDVNSLNFGFWKEKILT